MNEIAGNIRTTTVAVGAAAAAVTSTPTFCVWVLVQNDHDSAGHILVGGPAGQAHRLAPGASELFAVGDLSSVWLIRKVAGTAASANITYGA